MIFENFSWNVEKVVNEIKGRFWSWTVAKLGVNPKFSLKFD